MVWLPSRVYPIIELEGRRRDPIIEFGCAVVAALPLLRWRKVMIYGDWPSFWKCVAYAVFLARGLRAHIMHLDNIGLRMLRDFAYLSKTRDRWHVAQHVANTLSILPTKRTRQDGVACMNCAGEVRTRWERVVHARTHYWHGTLQTSVLYCCVIWYVFPKNGEVCLVVRDVANMSPTFPTKWMCGIPGHITIY